MKFITTLLKDAYIIEPASFEDERGKFTRVFCKNEFSKIGHTKEFVQFNHSLTKLKGTVRGMHFQRTPYEEIKLIRCIRGSVFDVIVDVRPQSPTFLKWFGEVLSADNMKMMYVPEGFAHGFQTLESDCELLYHHTQFYTPQYENGVNSLDKLIDIKWPLEISLITDKDRSLPFINKNSNVLI
jgi:dTDP-4-dehydrorhamnose 3,5-epimerase